MIKTIDITPSWSDMVEVIIICLNSPGAEKAGRDELYRMAQAADLWNAHCQAENKA